MNTDQSHDPLEVLTNTAMALVDIKQILGVETDAEAVEMVRRLKAYYKQMHELRRGE